MVKLSDLAKRLGSVEDYERGSGGFSLVKTESREYVDEGKFVTALEEQAEATERLQTNRENVTGVDLDGTLLGTKYRLTRDAFSDVCRFSGVPSAFLNNLAVHDRDLADNVLKTMISKVFHGTSGKDMIIDTRTNLVEGVVGSSTYSSFNNSKLYEYARSSIAQEVTVGRMWLAGPYMRTTFAVAGVDVNPNRTAAGKQVGDLVSVGMAIENATNGDQSLRVSNYAERIVCTNGMVRATHGQEGSIRHQGDVEKYVVNLLTSVSNNIDSMIPAITGASDIYVQDSDLENVRKYVTNAKFGGSKKLHEAVMAHANEEAYLGGRDRVSVWDITNGINAQAHERTSFVQKTALERMSFAFMETFSAALKN